MSAAPHCADEIVGMTPNSPVQAGARRRHRPADRLHPEPPSPASPRSCLERGPRAGEAPRRNLAPAPSPHPPSGQSAPGPEPTLARRPTRGWTRAANHTAVGPRHPPRRVPTPDPMSFARPGPRADPSRARGQADPTRGTSAWAIDQGQASRSLPRSARGAPPRNRSEKRRTGTFKGVPTILSAKVKLPTAMSANPMECSRS